MNTERTVILENRGDCPIGLADTQGRMYRLAKGAKMRISATTLQDIFDYPGSRAIFKEGLAQVSNITVEELYNMGLTEEEIDDYLLEETRPALNKKEEKEEEKEEAPVVEKKAPAKTTVKKTTAKKTATKKTTTKAK